MRSPVAGKARVHELAKELGVESKVVLAKLKEMGEFVKSASSTVEAPVARRLKEMFPASVDGAAAAGPAPARTPPPPAKKASGPVGVRSRLVPAQVRARRPGCRRGRVRVPATTRSASARALPACRRGPVRVPVAPAARRPAPATRRAPEAPGPARAVAGRI